jgi:hypothetical protein
MVGAMVKGLTSDHSLITHLILWEASMKRFTGVLLIVTLASLFLVSLSFGQMAYKSGDNVLSAGLGLGGFAGVYGDATLPPISVGYEVGYNENISIGGLAGIAGSEAKYTWFGGSYGWEYTYIIIAARGAYHFDVFKNERIDSYAGVTIGYNIVSVKETGNIPGGFSASGSYFLYGGHLGLRYYFSPNLGAQIELGYGIGTINVGIAYNM